MIKFNPEAITAKETCAPALDITDKTEAEQYLADYAIFSKKDNESLEASIKACKNNLVCYADFVSPESRDRIERLFDCEHPFFGSIAKNGIPSLEKQIAWKLKVSKAMDDLGY